MAWTILRLKLRLYRRANAEPAQLVWLIVGGAFLLVAALAVHAALRSLRGLPAHGEPIAVAIFTAIAALWVVLAVSIAGTGELLPGRSLDLLPLPKRRRAVGFLLAAGIGVVPLATAIALLGAPLGAQAGLATLLALAAAIVELALCLMLSLAIGAWISAASTSRKSRDLSVVLTAAVSIGALVAYTAANRSLGRATAVHASRATDILAWLPPGALGRAVAAAEERRYLSAAGLIVYAGASVAILAWLWGIGLDRRPREAGGSARRKRRAGGLVLLPPVLRWAPARRWSAMAAAERRQQLRDPKRLTVYVSGIVAGALFIGRYFWASGNPAFAPVAVLDWALSSVVTTQIAYDGAAFWTIALATRSRPVLVGKHLATGILVLPPTAVAIVAIALWSHRPGTMLTALLAMLAVFAAGLGIGAYASAYEIYAIPRDPSRRAHRAGAGMSAIGYAIACLAFFGGIVGCIALGRTLTGSTAAGAAVALAGCSLVWLAGVTSGASRLDSHSPDTLAALAGP